MRRYSRTIITLAVLAVFAGYFVFNIESFKPLLHLNVALLVLIAAADLALICANGVVVKLILQPFNKWISITESIYVALISSVGNFFAPAGSGFGFRAVYLKRKHGLAYSEFISTLSGNYIIFLLVNSLIALAALAALRSRSGKEYFILVFVFVGFLLLSLVMVFVKLPKRDPEKSVNNRYLRRFIEVFFDAVNGWGKIAANRKLLAGLTLVIFFNFLVTLVVVKCEILSIHLAIGTTELVLFNVLGGLSLFINITPANLGVKESIYIFCSHVLGLSVSQVVLIGLIDRAVLFFVYAVLWLVFIKLRKGTNPLRTGNDAEE